MLAGADERFAEVIALIEKARARGYQAVNTVLVGHSWELGAYISRKIATAEWVHLTWLKTKGRRLKKAV